MVYVIVCPELVVELVGCGGSHFESHYEVLEDAELYLIQKFDVCFCDLDALRLLLLI